MQLITIVSIPTPTLRFLDSTQQLLEERPLLPAEDDQLAALTLAYRAPQPNLAAIGRQLFEWLDGNTTHPLSLTLQSAPATPWAINFNLHSDVLRRVPWELLALQHAHPFTPIRRVRTSPQPYARANRPLRVLFMACSPRNVKPELDFEAEEANILKAVKQISQRADIDLVVVEDGSLNGLADEINAHDPGYFDVVHISGHADVIAGIPRFVMEDELGERRDTTAAELADAFNGRLPRLIFFSGCKTAQAPDSGALPSLCEALIAAGAPAVLGWVEPVFDLHATVMAGELYAQLAVGARLDEAVAQARRELINQHDSHAWHLLRLYADATPLTELVTPPKTRGRERLRQREAASAFLDEQARLSGARLAGEPAANEATLAHLKVCAREDFVGRRREIQRGLRTLRAREDEPDYAEGLLIHGMGGLGKSSLAARLCERMPEHQRLVWFGALTEDNLPSLLGKLGAAITNPEAYKQWMSSDLPLKTRLRQLIATAFDATPALFIFDDFEQNLSLVDGVHIVDPTAGNLLHDLLLAIREGASDSRVIVTSRYAFGLPGPAHLRELGLERLRDASEQKKLDRLPNFAAAQPDLAARATELAAGNPRLLERLDALLGAAEVDSEAVLDQLAGAEADFREEIALRVLLAALPLGGQRLLALLAVYALPVDEAGIVAVAEAGAHVSDWQINTTRAVALGLLECGGSRESNDLRYYVSPLVRPLLEALCTEAELRQASAAGAHYWQARMASEEGLQETEALELRRLALKGGVLDVAADITNTISNRWIGQSRYREALSLVKETLEVVEDYRLRHQLARAQVILGQTDAALKNYQRALDDCPASDERNVVYERSAIMFNLATLIAQQGDVKHALDLWQQSLALLEQIGDVQGKAATLANMAGVIAQQGDVKRALDLWQQSLALKEQIGDVKGKAATLANMAWLASQQGDFEQAKGLNVQAALALAQVRAWLDLTTVLSNLGTPNSPEALGYLAQAYWLAAFVQVPALTVLNLAAAIFKLLTPTHPAAPYIATLATYAVQTRGQSHPEYEQHLRYGVGLLAACAEARNIPNDDFVAWLDREGLRDSDRFLPALDAALAELVGDGWLFDRNEVLGN